MTGTFKYRDNDLNANLTLSVNPIIKILFALASWLNVDVLIALIDILPIRMLLWLKYSIFELKMLRAETHF